MKKILASILALVSVLPLSSLFAATATTTSAKADHFEVTIKSTARVGEAIDMTVKVLDKTGNVKKDYNGTIYVTVDNDTKATVPYADDGYTYKNADQGVMTFSKGLSFTKEGKMKVTIIDAEDDNLEGSAQVTVSNGAAETTTSTGTEAVTIISPDNNSEIPSDSIKVTGSTKKNSKVQIFLNGTKAGEVQTDETGKFVYEIKKLEQEQNILQAKLFDGTDKVIGQSDNVTFKMSAGGPVFNTITIKEGKKVPAESVLNLEVGADAGLKEVSVTLGDATQTLKEQGAGKYTGTINAPSGSGSYPISVSLKNDLGKTTVKEAAETIEVTELPNLFKNVKSNVEAKKVTFTFELENAPTDLAKFRFQYGTESGTLDKESITLETTKIKNASGAYSWYIKDIDPATKYFRIAGLDKDGQPLTSMRASDLIELDISLAAASKCMVSNISGLKVTSQGYSTLLTWDVAADATSGYNVYKKGTDGQYTLLENVKTNSYTIHLAKDSVKFDDFAIKGVCNDGEGESADFAEVTKVQTGPTQILILLGLSALIGFYVTRRKFAFFKGS